MCAVKSSIKKHSNGRLTTLEMSRLSASSDEDPPEVIPPPKKQKRHRKEVSEDYESFKPPKKQKSVFINFSKKDDNSENEDDPDSEPENYKPSFAKRGTFESKIAPPRPVAEVYGKAEKMMKKLGYVSGEGLGKHKQGRVEPVGLSTQQGKRGMGYVPTSQGKPYEGPRWDPTTESVSIYETPIWADESPAEQMSREELDDGMVIGPQKLTIDDENEFCDPKVLEDILSLKSLFDQIPKEKLRTLVGRCNLYESIENAFFINRAALKMANMDYVFDFMFTKPKKEDGSHVIEYDKLLYFADVCAGPGGFSEYVLWRKKWRAKGFGFTLRGSNDFKLSNMLAAPIESFFPYYGENDDGDIFNPSNLISLKNHVLKHTDDQGVHFLMGDGGFSVEGEENIQEIKSKQLYLCQCIAALSLVREGGHFVVKLFDTFTEFSVGLIYLMYRSFKNICIHKPITSRPANSERYLICKWKRLDSDTIERYLFHVNELLWKFSREKSTKDITKLVSLDILQGDKVFYKFICDANNRIGETQIVNLLKINECHLDGNLLDTLMYDGKLSHEEKKAEIKATSLELWKIPNEKRKTAKKVTHTEQIQLLIDGMKLKADYVSEDILKKCFTHQPKCIKGDKDLENEDQNSKDNRLIKYVHDWYYIYCNTTKESSFNFYLGLGSLDVFKLEGRSWIKVQGISLPEGTLIYAEDVEEKRGEGRGIHKSHSLHIIDAFSLGPEFIFHYNQKLRNQYIKLFCSSLSIPSTNQSDKVTYPLRSKQLYKFSSLPKELDKLTERRLKNGMPGMTTTVPFMKDNSDMYFVVECLIFFRFTKDPWITCFSKSNNREYFFNCRNNESRFDVASNSYNHTFDSLLSSLKCPYLRDGRCLSGGLRSLIQKYSKELSF